LSSAYTYAAIDIGSSKVCGVAVEVNSGRHTILGESVRHGCYVKKGVIIDIDNLSECVKSILTDMCAKAEADIRSLYVNLDADQLTVRDKRVRIPTDPDREIGQADINAVMDAAKDTENEVGYFVLQVLSDSYTVDDYGEVTDPIGLTGKGLTMDAVVISAKSSYVNALTKCFQKSGIEIDGLIPSGLSLGEMILSEDEKKGGAAIIDVGGESTDIYVYHEMNMRACRSLPVGGQHMSNDVSLVFNVTAADSEKIKKELNIASVGKIMNNQYVSLEDISNGERNKFLVSDLVEVFEARVCEIFQICREAVFDCSGTPIRSVVLTGGGIEPMSGSKEIAESVFGIPVRVLSYKTYGIPGKEYVNVCSIIDFLSSRPEKGQYANVVARNGKDPVTLINKLKKSFMDFIRK